MTELLLKVFNKKEYWKREMNKLHDIMIGAEFRWRKAIRLHQKSADLSFEYKLARLNFEKAFQQYQKATGY